MLIWWGYLRISLSEGKAVEISCRMIPMCSVDMNGYGAEEIWSPRMGIISLRITSWSPASDGSPALVSSRRKAAILFCPKYRDSVVSSSSDIWLILPFIRTSRKIKISTWLISQVDSFGTVLNQREKHQYYCLPGHRSFLWEFSLSGEWGLFNPEIESNGNPAWAFPFPFTFGFLASPPCCFGLYEHKLAWFLLSQFKHGCLLSHFTFRCRHGQQAVPSQKH